RIDHLVIPNLARRVFSPLRVGSHQGKIERAAAEIVSEHNRLPVRLRMLGQIIKRGGSGLGDGADYLEMRPVFERGTLHQTDQMLALGTEIRRRVRKRNQIRGELPADVQLPVCTA